MTAAQRLSAGVEVSVVTALSWFAYKGLRLIEPGTFNMSPGLAMLLAGAAMIAVHRRDFATFGVASDQWLAGVNLGIAFGVLLLSGGALEVALFSLTDQTPDTIATSTALAIGAIRLILLLSLVLCVRKPAWRGAIERVPGLISLPLLAALLLAAPGWTIARGFPPLDVAGWTVTLVTLTALGEELFFRGYVQSRLNLAYGRPWQVMGARCGPGLVLAALLFGAIHVLNPAHPFHGVWKLSWQWGAAAFLSGVLFGYLRELTGSIWAGVIVHALTGEYRGLWQVFLSRDAFPA